MYGRMLYYLNQTPEICILSTVHNSPGTAVVLSHLNGKA